MFPLCSLRPLWFTFVFFVPGCASHDQSDTPPERAATQPAALAYIETVPGSTVKFTMRPVTITEESGTQRTLWFAETETTWDAYDVFSLRLDENAANVAAAGAEGPDAITRPTQPYSPADRGWGHGGYPVISVTHNAATKYCEWLTQKTGRHYRLPTTLEYRHALVAAPADEPQKLLDVCWLGENSQETTHPVAAKAANSDGLYDVAGNVAEWCIGEAGKPVVMGGSFQTPAAGATTPEVWRSGTRQTSKWTEGDPSYPPSKWWLRSGPHVGFRVVCEEPPR